MHWIRETIIRSRWRKFREHLPLLTFKGHLCRLYEDVFVHVSETLAGKEDNL